MYIGLYRNFMNLKLTLLIINRTIENKNKEKKHTFKSMDGGFDKTFYYKQNKLCKVEFFQSCVGFIPCQICL